MLEADCAQVLPRLPDGLVVVDAKLHVLEANARFGKMVGITDPAGRTLYDLLRNRALYDVFGETVASGQPAERTVRLADGFIGAGGSSTAQFASEAAELRQLLEAAGRDPATFPLSKRVYIAVDHDKARAGNRLAERLGNAYGGTSSQPTHERVAVFGPPDECVAKLRQLTNAGASLIVLTPLFDEAEQLEIFAEQIRPHL